MTESTIMPFGKYKGETIRAIFHFDRKYLMWVLESCDITPTLYSAIEDQLSK